MNWIPVLAGLIPSICVGLLFWFVMRAVVRADRNERTALAHADDSSRRAPGDDESTSQQAGSQ